MRDAVLISGLSLVALARSEPVFASDLTASYACDDGTRMIARFHNAPAGLGSVTLIFPDSAKLTISQSVSADGGRYAAGKVEFWIKGKRARFTQDGKPATCRAS